MKTAVLMLVFNRPSETSRVLAAIKEAAPERLYVACDGPREGRPGERERVDQVRNLFADPGWKVEVKTLFRKTNLGCKTAVAEGISWFFSQEPEGIILEDDCLPHRDFFPYCEALLEKYREDPKVMHIAGVNFQRGILRGEASYYFSRYVHVWGWASWRRAWDKYDASMATWPGFTAAGGMERIHRRKSAVRYWTKVMDEVAAGGVNTWDYQWVYSLWAAGGLAVIPQVNLVENIGFGEGATHTTSAADKPEEMKVQGLSWPLSFSDNKEIDEDADFVTERAQFIFSFPKRAAVRIKVLWKRFFTRE